MARFMNDNQTDILDLLDSVDSNNTKKTIKCSVQILKEYCMEKGIDFISMDNAKDINELLCKFYTSVCSYKKWRIL